MKNKIATKTEYSHCSINTTLELKNTRNNENQESLICHVWLTIHWSFIVYGKNIATCSKGYTETPTFGSQMPEMLMKC